VQASQWYSLVAVAALNEGHLNNTTTIKSWLLPAHVGLVNI
jgi:hypothetical protein